ncbi:MAG: hypothetical protein ACRYFX_22190 [Janthinobacterium lividum]
MQLPASYESPEAALLALSDYCQRRYQARGFCCEALPLNEAQHLGSRHRRWWLHPSLEQPGG